MATKILFISANAPNTPHLDIEKEQRNVEESLKRSKHREQFEIKLVPAIQGDDLPIVLSNEGPAIVHFSGHGLEAGLMLRATDNPVSGKQLAKLLSGRAVRLVFLNACFSMEHARAINKVVPSVVGTTKAVHDADALAFSKAFHRSLGDGHDVGKAFVNAKATIALSNGEDVFRSLGDMNLTFWQEPPDLGGKTARVDRTSHRPFYRAAAGIAGIVTLLAVVWQINRGVEPYTTAAPPTSPPPKAEPPIAAKVEPSFKVCGEFDHCSGTVLSCQHAGDDKDGVSRVSYADDLHPILFGPWRNPQCVTEGAGWHQAAGTCEWGLGNGFKRCLSVRVQN